MLGEQDPKTPSVRTCLLVVGRGSWVPIASRGSWFPSRGSWVPSRGFQVVGRGFQVVSRGFQVVGRGFQVVGRGSQVVGREFQVVGRGPWVIDWKGSALACRRFFGIPSISKQTLSSLQQQQIILVSIPGKPILFLYNRPKLGDLYN